MATQIKLKRGTSLNSDYTIGAFGNNAEPWFISGTGLNQMYVDGICINPHIKVGAGLAITETLGAAGALETYNTLSFDLSTYTSTTMGNALELISTGTAGEVGLFAGYDLFVGGESDTSMAASVADDAVYIHMRSKNGNNHDKIKIVSGEGATVTAANDIITVSATGIGVTLYDLLWSNYGGSTSSFYDPETSGYTFNVTGGLKFTQAGLVTTLTDTRTLIVGNSKTDVANETFSGTAYINLIGDNNSVGTKGVFGSVALGAGDGIALDAMEGVIKISSTVTDTHYTSTNIVAGTNSATTQATVASNGVYLNHLEETALSSSTYILGSNGIKVFSDVSGKINIRGTRIVVSNSATGITDGTSFSGPVYINLVGDNDSDDTLEVLDSVKLVGSGTASLAVGATAKEITITGTDNNTEYELKYGILSGGGGVDLTIDSVADPLRIKNQDSSLEFTQNLSEPNSFYIDVVLIDGGIF